MYQTAKNEKYQKEEEIRSYNFYTSATPISTFICWFFSVLIFITRFI